MTDDLTAPDDDIFRGCWWHRFGGGEPCPRPGRWGNPDGLAVVRHMRWCDEHRHATDVLMEAARDPLGRSAR